MNVPVSRLAVAALEDAAMEDAALEAAALEDAALEDVALEDVALEDVALGLLAAYGRRRAFWRPWTALDGPAGPRWADRACCVPACVLGLPASAACCILNADGLALRQRRARPPRIAWRRALGWGLGYDLGLMEENVMVFAGFPSFDGWTCAFNFNAWPVTGEFIKGDFRDNDAEVVDRLAPPAFRRVVRGFEIRVDPPLWATEEEVEAMLAEMSRFLGEAAEREFNHMEAKNREILEARAPEDTSWERLT